jgi:superoxide dismutase, Fe-Mn family
MKRNVVDLNRRQFLAGAVAGTALLAAGAVSVPSVLHAVSNDKKATPPASPPVDLLYKTPWRSPAGSGTAPFDLPPLPYAQDALAPHISAETLEFHYGKHHRGYIDKINGLVENTDWIGKFLDEIIRGTAGNPDKAAIFNNAAQAWNHEFYWQSMRSGGGGAPSADLAKKIEADFGNFNNFKNAFASAAATQFGSGWAWLVMESGSLKIVKTANADTPMVHNQLPILTIDVWEHAYYIDYRNRRADYIAAYLDHLVNWDFAAKNFGNS